MIIWAGAGVAALAFFISFFTTPIAGRMATRFGMLDIPGGRKAHAKPVPMLGGCAIFLAVLTPSMLVLAFAAIMNPANPPQWLPDELSVHLPGLASKSMTALGILAAAAVLHVVGLIDDRRHLGPGWKLLAQFAAAAFVALFCDVRVLTVGGSTVSVILSILWMVGITNAFNFLDNMDGLSAGVAAICTAALLMAAASMGQLFVSAWLCLMLGALLGFLPYNFPPAKIFMGDGGSLVVGFLLAVVSCLITYVRPGQTYYLYGVFMPLVLMAVPLYDMASVIVLRLRLRRSPMVGDRRHFSHRLVRRGMRVRTAVLTIYLCTLATAISAALLARVSGNVAAVMIFAQTTAVLLIVALLESSSSK